MANLYDVAKKAGVSKTLVSRVLNNQKGVSEQSREKIQKAMAELNYTPNGVARSLVMQKTSLIGVILDTLCEPYYFDLIKGIEGEIAKSNYRVVFCSGQNKSSLKDSYIDFFSGGRSDGVIIYGSNIDDVELIHRRAMSNFPFVVVENPVEDIQVNNIVVDNEYGSAAAVNHLVERGCRSIYHVAGEETIKAAVDRKNGYIAAMQARGFSENEIVILPSTFDKKDGYQAIDTFIREQGKERLPDAFYFTSDNTAFGGMMALEDHGIRIPEDVRVVGFDDDLPYGIDRPLKKLTTIRQPMYEVGKKAAQMLIEQIKKPSAPKQKVIYTTELVIRETS